MSANVPAIVLIVLALVLTFIMVGLIVWGVSSRGAKEQETGQGQGQGQGGSGTLQICTSVPNSELVEIPDTLPACTVNGQVQDIYYIGRISQFDITVTSHPTPIDQVCRDFCKSFEKNVCVGPNYGGRSAQLNYKECLAQYSTEGVCQGPPPVARKGTRLYYPMSPTCHHCDFC